MDINYFREFAVLCKSKTFLEAADSLYISQSSLSRHIKTMEDELGVQLFNRTTRRVSLTKIGEAFLPYAQKIADIQAEYQKFLSNEQHHAAESLTIGSIPSMTQGSVADNLEAFTRRHPACRISTIEADSLQLKEMLHGQECDMAFLRDFDDPSGEFCKIPVLLDAMVAIVPWDHPFAQNDSVSLQDLAGEPLLWLSRNTFLHSLCERAFQEQNLHPNVVFTSHNGDNIIYHVGRGLGIAMLMKDHARRLATEEVRLIDISPAITSTVVLAYRREKKLSATASQLLQMVHAISDCR